MANPPEPATTGLISIAAAAIATGGAILQGVWRGRDEREKEERMRKQKLDDEERARQQKEADEEAAATSARLRKLEERMNTQDVTNARQDEAIRNIDTANFFFDGTVGLVIVASGVLTGTDLTEATAYADGWTL